MGQILLTDISRPNMCTHVPDRSNIHIIPRVGMQHINANTFQHNTVPGYKLNIHILFNNNIFFAFYLKLPQCSHEHQQKSDKPSSCSACTVGMTLILYSTNTKTLGKAFHSALSHGSHDK